MAYKDPPKEKYHNGAPCAVIAIAMIGAVAAIVALVGAPSGWWA